MEGSVATAAAAALASAATKAKVRRRDLFTVTYSILLSPPYLLPHCFILTPLFNVPPVCVTILTE